MRNAEFKKRALTRWIGRSFAVTALLRGASERGLQRSDFQNPHSEIPFRIPNSAFARFRIPNSPGPLIESDAGLSDVNCPDEFYSHDSIALAA